MNARKFSKAVGCHNCGDGFTGEIIKTRKGIYCSLCGAVFSEDDHHFKNPARFLKSSKLCLQSIKLKGVNS